MGYFFKNPYDRWFGVLDRAIAGTKSSYYSSTTSACHIDLVPYATRNKWGALQHDQRLRLLQTNGDIVGRILQGLTNSYSDSKWQVGN